MLVPLHQRLLMAAVVFLVSEAEGGDWPQILGPERNGQAAGEQLLAKWPAGGPQVLWRFRLGSGYAGVAVLGGRVVVFHRVGASERIECLSEERGKSLWKTDFPANYRGGIDPDTGPRCVPLLAGDAAYVFGAAGDLHCVELATGKHRWSRSLYEEYGGDEGYFGAGSTPLLIAGKLLVNVGARRAGLVGLDANSGKTLWQATDEAASYSSPTIVTAGGQQRALFVTRLNCVLADPSTGQTTTLFPFGKRGPTVNAATPLVLEKRLFVTASYGVGARLASLDGNSAATVWSNDDSLSCQYATPVERDGFLFGIHGREDVGIAELRCVEAASGRIRWKQPNFGVAHLILAGDKLLLQKADGRLVLASATPDRYEELGSAQIAMEPTRALPALAAGRLYVRTGSGGGELLCLEVGTR